jgi:hypothetical protein
MVRKKPFAFSVASTGIRTVPGPVDGGDLGAQHILLAIARDHHQAVAVRVCKAISRPVRGSVGYSRTTIWDLRGLAQSHRESVFAL